MIVYGRNAVREALRGRRAASAGEVLAIAPLAREPWLGAQRVRVATAEEIERACGSREHQGVCVELSGYPYVSTGELLGVPSPFIVALDEVQDPQNLGAICSYRRMRRRQRPRDLRAARGGRDRGRLPCLGGRRRASARRAGHQPGRFPARRARRGLLELRRGDLRAGRGLPRARLPRRRRGRVRRRGAGPSPACRGVLRSARRDAAARAGSPRSTSTPPPVRFCTRCCIAAQPLTALHNCG